jgi:hypothetical protein
MSVLNKSLIVGTSFKTIPDSPPTVAIIEATAGGTDPTKYGLSHPHFVLRITCYNVPFLRYIGEINYFPVTMASSHWGFELDVAYGTATVIAGSSNGIIEHLSCLNLLEPDAFKAYQQATGATIDE